MTADIIESSNNMVLRWVPYHLVYALDEMRKHWRHMPLTVKGCVKGIVENMSQFSTAKEESGDGWEALFLAVTIIRCLSHTFESKVLPLSFLLENEYEINYNRPWSGTNFNMEQDPVTFVQGIPQTVDGSKVSIYYPGHARFADYDIIVAVWKEGGRQLYGYQLKEGWSATKGFALDDVFDASYLIRGVATTRAASIRLYQTPSDDQLEEFFGVSGSQWTPKQWKKLEA